MLNITFKYRKPAANSPQFIYLVVRFGRNDKLIYNTGLKVAPKYWNFEKMRVRAMVEVPEREYINSRLADFSAALNGFYLENKIKGREAGREELRLFLDRFTGKKEGLTGSEFHDFIKDYLKKNTDRVNQKTGRVISYRTQRTHIQLYKVLQDFEKQRRGGRLLDFQDITLDFYSDFQDYLQAAGMAKNTIAQKIRTLKTWLNEATARGINTNLQYKSTHFKASTEDADTIYLTYKELEELAAVSFENTRLCRVRDLFLVSAYTGLRFSDTKAVAAGNIAGDFITIRQQKTGGEVKIPFHPVVKNILEKYGDEFPPQISNQKFNKYIKEVCKLAGFDKMIQTTITKGGVRVSRFAPKYELISSHTARRSFATNLYLDGFPVLSIMQITGHRTQAAFLKYIRATAEQHANKLREFWRKKGEYMKQIK